jgi:hypothetical protein
LYNLIIKNKNKRGQKKARNLMKHAEKSLSTIDEKIFIANKTLRCQRKQKISNKVRDLILKVGKFDETRSKKV